MKRVALLCMGLALGAAQAAEAQLTMQMSNGWSFTFAGNVNAFAIYESQSEDGATVAPGGLIGVGGKGFSIRTRRARKARRISASISDSPHRSSAVGRHTTASVPRSTCVRCF
jgi:hypothetical protein